MRKVDKEPLQHFNLFPSPAEGYDEFVGIAVYADNRPDFRTATEECMSICWKNNSAQRWKLEASEMFIHRFRDRRMRMDELQGVKILHFGKTLAKFREHSFDT